MVTVVPVADALVVHPLPRPLNVPTVGVAGTVNVEGNTTVTVLLLYELPLVAGVKETVQLELAPATSDEPENPTLDTLEADAAVTPMIVTPVIAASVAASATSTRRDHPLWGATASLVATESRGVRITGIRSRSAWRRSEHHCPR